MYETINAKIINSSENGSVIRLGEEVLSIDQAAISQGRGDYKPGNLQGLGFVNGDGKPMRFDPGCSIMGIQSVLKEKG